IFGTISLLLWTGYLSNPYLHVVLRPFMTLSYGSNTEPKYYSKGVYDLYFVAQLSILLIFARASFSKYIGRPLAARIKIIQPGKQFRFSEQLWGLICAAFSWVYGCYLIYKYPEYLRISTVWTSYPLLRLPADFKLYYLYIICFWLCSSLYLFVEKQRNDIVAMFFHHSTTVLLLFSSYYTNYSAIGTIIHFLMDFSDIFLPLSKILNYMGYTTFCYSVFGFTVLSWIGTRHFALARIIYSVAVEAQTYMDYGYDPSSGYYASKLVQVLFIVFLSFLEILCLFWLALLLKILWATLFSTDARDTRSDDE
ncbi:hypothetical protein BB560_002956, partial [Smittium megazygosporum]